MGVRRVRRRPEVIAPASNSGLRPAPGSDADAAWLFWAASDLARHGREMIAIGWQWRTARPRDVTTSGELLQSAAGWVTVAQTDPKRISARWMATTPDDLLPLLDGLLDLAAERASRRARHQAPRPGLDRRGSPPGRGTDRPDDRPLQADLSGENGEA